MIIANTHQTYKCIFITLDIARIKKYKIKTQQEEIGHWYGFTGWHGSRDGRKLPFFTCLSKNTQITREAKVCMMSYFWRSSPDLFIALCKTKQNYPSHIYLSDFSSSCVPKKKLQFFLGSLSHKIVRGFYGNSLENKNNW